MATFLTFLQQHQTGIYVGLACLIVLAALIQWFAWIFRLGRFERQQASTSDSAQGIRYIVADLFVKVIDDFRHLLALVLVIIFAVVLLYVLLFPSNVDNIGKGLQAVASSLGGIIGVIIGYYFGESASKVPTTDTTPIGNEPEQQERVLQEQTDQQDANEQIRPAPSPPDQS